MTAVLTVIFFDRELLLLFGAEETLLPAVAPASAIWFAMPITEAVVAVFVVWKMTRCTIALIKNS